METETDTQAEKPRQLPDELRVSPVEFVLLQVFFTVCNTVGRTLDMLLLLPRPRLLRAYVGLWWARVLRSPYTWPRSFEAVRKLKTTGQTLRELMYGETPVVTALWLFWRAGVRRGSRLVDVGAGRGRALLAARWLGAEARGLELLAEHVSLTAGMLKRTGAELVQADALTEPLDGVTHVFVNWTAFSPTTKQRLAERFRQCPPGTRIITVTRPIEGDGFKVRSRHLQLFTWGVERVWIQERV